ncbi:hypothetical protein ABFX02_02G044500 [Erythranthe guttata]
MGKLLYSILGLLLLSTLISDSLGDRNVCVNNIVGVECYVSIKGSCDGLCGGAYGGNYIGGDCIIDRYNVRSCRCSYYC